MAGYITGYRGSPLGGLDGQFLRAAPIAEDDILSQGGIDEDLAATALSLPGTADSRKSGRNSVFAMWFGRGAEHRSPATSSATPTLPAPPSTAATWRDRRRPSADPRPPRLAVRIRTSSDVDDPGAQSPAGVQEVLDYGLLRLGDVALHRRRGSALIDAGRQPSSSTRGDRRQPRTRHQRSSSPDRTSSIPEGGLGIRLAGPDRSAQEAAPARTQSVPAALAFARANTHRPHHRLGRGAVRGSASPATGQSVSRTCAEALDEPSASTQAEACHDLGVRALQGRHAPGRSEPAASSRGFAAGLETRHRRRAQAPAHRESRPAPRSTAPAGPRAAEDASARPTKSGQPAAPGERASLDPRRKSRSGDRRPPAAGYRTWIGSTTACSRVARLKEYQRIAADTLSASTSSASPYFCSGCPHNTSTAAARRGPAPCAGIGCHYMAQLRRTPRRSASYSHMGGEGAEAGSAPRRSPKRKHVFRDNLGDGTYNHSGYMAIRAAIAYRNTNITYKILFNDAVAMTGGQANDGGLTAPQVARQVAAEGAKRVVVVTDEPDKYPAGTAWPSGLTVHHPRRSDGSAGGSRNSRRHRADLRPDLRGGKAPPPQASSTPIPTSASSSTNWSAKGAAIAASSRIACRCSRSRPSGGASAPSTSRAATRTFPA